MLLVPSVISRSIDPRKPNWTGISGNWIVLLVPSVIGLTTNVAAKTKIWRDSGNMMVLLVASTMLEPASPASTNKKIELDVPGAMPAVNGFPLST